jgi:protein-tyrosine-phosphatase
MAILFLCTGNAARSVMAETFARRLAPDWPVASAGTLAIDGLPTSVRTAAALAELGFEARRHRSRQVSEADMARAELIVIFEPFHLLYVRRHHPEAAARTGSLPRLARDLPPAQAPGASLAARVAALQLGDVTFEPWDEVPDPAGGNSDDFTKCAATILHLVGELTARLGPWRENPVLDEDIS